MGESPVASWRSWSLSQGNKVLPVVFQHEEGKSGDVSALNTLICSLPEVHGVESAAIAATNARAGSGV